MRAAIRLRDLPSEALQQLSELCRTTKDVRLRTRAQMVLLAAEQHLVAADIAAIVRTDEETVHRWLKRYRAEGLRGLSDQPRAGGPPKVTPAYQEQLVRIVRQRPRSLGQPYSLWTLQRLADYMAEATGLRVEAETVRLHLKQAGIVMSRPQHQITSPDPEYAVKKRRLKTPGTTSHPTPSFTMPTSST